MGTQWMVHASRRPDPHSLADFDEEGSDSWRGNNDASTNDQGEDFYPNEEGGPAARPGRSIKVPPVLCDLDGVPGRDLEILLAQRATTSRCFAWTLLSRSGNPTCMSSARRVPIPESLFGDTILDQDIHPSRRWRTCWGMQVKSSSTGWIELLVFDLSTPEPLCSFEHGDDLGTGPVSPHRSPGETSRGDDHAERDEIICLPRSAT